MIGVGPASEVDAGASGGRNDREVCRCTVPCERLPVTTVACENVTPWSSPPCPPCDDDAACADPPTRRPAP